MVPLSLKRNVSFMLIGNLIYALSQWGIIMVLAKLGSPKMVGGFTLGLAVTAPIILIFDLQLRSVLATDIKNEYSFQQYLFLKGVSSFIALVVLGIVIVIGDYKGQVAFVIFLVGTAKLVESVIELHYGLFQKHERMDMIAKSLVIRGFSSLFIIAILITLTKSLLIAVTGFALSWLFVLVMFESPKAKQMVVTDASSFNIHSLKRLFLTSFPLGVVMMMISLYSNIPRYVIERISGTEAVGYFSALFYIVTAGNLVINAIGQTISPRLASYFSNKEYTKFSKLLMKFVLLGFIYGLCGIILTLIIGKQVLSIVYTQDYIKFHKVFVLLMIAGTLMYAGSFFGFALTAMRKFSIQPILSSIWVISTIILSIIIIPHFGLTGAAIVSIITTAIQQLTLAITVMVYLVQAKKHHRLSIQNSN
ncbi:oligosaccharide flippase family protein [Neobacillus drentensis]|uniref:oligosaccharide flippase family protein n=1 Tax=Neobacillus drentensis TaxID=220684 RepID=UPI00082477AC|nr:oligosaccharide flippase family protein [Neobacillus drentensis]